VTGLTAGNAIGQARLAILEAALRRRLHAAAAGAGPTLAIDLDDRGLDVAAVLRAVVGGLPPGGPEVERLATAFEQGQFSDQAVARLSAADPVLQITGAEIVGALRLERAIPWLAPLLTVQNRAVRDAAARALGKIGGARSAEALISTIQRSGPSRILVTELARAAPDQFLESALKHPPRGRVRWAAAAAAGLRRRRPAVTPLIALLASGSRRERTISCKALGWIGAPSAVPAITAALMDREPRVRAAAERALKAVSHAGRRAAGHPRGTH
jgi:HEAT repeat protein